MSYQEPNINCSFYLFAIFILHHNVNLRGRTRRPSPRRRHRFLLDQNRIRQRRPFAGNLQFHHGRGAQQQRIDDDHDHDDDNQFFPFQLLPSAETRFRNPLRRRSRYRWRVDSATGWLFSPLSKAADGGRDTVRGESSLNSSFASKLLGGNTEEDLFVGGERMMISVPRRRNDEFSSSIIIGSRRHRRRWDPPVSATRIKTTKAGLATNNIINIIINIIIQPSSVPPPALDSIPASLPIDNNNNNNNIHRAPPAIS